MRLGKKDLVEAGSENKTRPLMIKFETLEYKKNVHHFCNDLYYIDENKLRTKIHYSNDLTRKERDARKLLVNERNLRRDQGEKNLYIRNGEIVQLEQQFFRSKAQPSFQRSWASLFKQTPSSEEDKSTKSNA